MSTRSVVPSVQGMRMPLLGADLAERIDYVAERRKAIYPTAEARAELAQLEALSADLAERLCQRMEALGPLAKAEDVFAYFRLRLDAVKLITFLGHEERILMTAAEGRNRYAPFWRQLRSWPSFEGGRGRKATTADDRAAFLRSVYALASARGAISKAALIANLELCRPLLKAHHSLMQVGRGTVGVNDMSRFRAPAYENAFKVTCLAFGIPLLAFQPKKPLSERHLEGFDLATDLGRHLIQLMLLDALPSRHLMQVRAILGREAAREFAATFLFRTSAHLLSEDQTSRLFGKHATTFRNAKLTAVHCRT